MPDQNRGGVRPSSAAFEDDPDGNPMSVFVERLVRSGQASEAQVMAGHEGFALASIMAGLARKNGQGVALEETSVPGHAVVFGRKTKSVSRSFAQSALWVIPPAEQGK